MPVYITIVDIHLMFLESQANHLDLCKYCTPHRLYVPQPPSQFVDDFNIFTRSLAGIAHAEECSRIGGIFLNLRTNPSKKNFFALQYDHLDSILPNDSVFLTSIDTRGCPVQVRAHSVHDAIRVLGAHIAMNQGDTSTLNSLRTTVEQFSPRKSLSGSQNEGNHKCLAP